MKAFIFSMGVIMKKIGVISVILEEPNLCQKEFNDVISSFKGIIKGRMGIPFEEEGLAVISLTIVGDLNDINSLTGKLGNIQHVLVKTAISKKEL
jgi:putative iron-only hydrogenase system regulator